MTARCLLLQLVSTHQGPFSSKAVTNDKKNYNDLVSIRITEMDNSKRSTTTWLPDDSLKQYFYIFFLKNTCKQIFIIQASDSHRHKLSLSCGFSFFKLRIKTIFHHIKSVNCHFEKIFTLMYPCLSA